MKTIYNLEWIEAELIYIKIQHSRIDHSIAATVTERAHTHIKRGNSRQPGACTHVKACTHWDALVAPDEGRQARSFCTAASGEFWDKLDGVKFYLEI